METRKRGRPRFDAARGKTRLVPLRLPEALCLVLEKSGHVSVAARKAVTWAVEYEAANRILADVRRKQKPDPLDMALFGPCAMCDGKGESDVDTGQKTGGATCLSCEGSGKALPA